MKINTFLKSFILVNFLLLGANGYSVGDRGKQKLVIQPSPVIEGIPNYKVKIAYIQLRPEIRQTVLFIHGNSASKDFFNAVLEQSALDHFRVVAVDLPGHGESSDFPELLKTHFKEQEKSIFVNSRDFYTFPGYAAVLLNFIRAMNISPESLTVVGWSLGGHVAIEMMEQEPNIHHVSLIGTPVSSHEATQGSFASLKDISVSGFQANNLFDLLSYDKAFLPDEAITFHRFGGFGDEAISRPAGIRTDPLARKFMIGHAFGASSSPQRGPDQDKTVLTNAAKFSIIQGQNDPIKIPEAELAKLRAAGVRIYEIKGAGHAAFSESPEAYTAKVVEFSLD